MKTFFLFFVKAFLFSVALSFVAGNVALWMGVIMLLNVPVLFVRKGARAISGILCIDVGTIASGVGTPTPVPLQYCPQVINWIQTAAVDINVKVLGDGTTYDIVAAGITETGVSRQLGRFTNQYNVVLANGLLLNKTTTITVTNQVASSFTLYAASENRGDRYIKGITQNMLAASGVEFSNFLFICFPSAGATDLYTLTYIDGTNQPYRREDLRTRLQRFQNVINAAGYSLDNYDGSVMKINVLPTAQQNAYLLQLVSAKGTAADQALIARAG
jgi:hypothetical protein